ncbi:hypothetical protein SDC9_205968 [bioreactor metagenome]|uniref:Uncharacterized protein n=1 Tax=bioreactor metagenome TaxID=1076179 RepID=A0A645J3G8_9ZZZZ
MDIDYIMASFYCEKHPDSIFNKIIKLAIFHDTGHIALDGSNLKFFEGPEIVKRQELQNQEDYASAVQNIFGIQVEEGCHFHRD